MTQRDIFEGLLCQVGQRAARLLVALKEQGDVSMARVWELACELGIRDGMATLERLVSFNLVRCRGEVWGPTWLGVGVGGWYEQLRFVRRSGEPSRLPEPLLGENGRDPSAQPCDRFRPVYLTPGRCWCGRERFQHLDEVLWYAEMLVRQPVREDRVS